MNESSLVTKIIKYLREQGAYVEKIWGGGFQSAGIPDIVGCYKGRFFGIEVKVGKNYASELQKAKINLINDAGGIAFVTWDNLEDTIAMIDMIDSNECINLKEVDYDYTSRRNSDEVLFRDYKNRRR